MNSAPGAPDSGQLVQLGAVALELLALLLDHLGRRLGDEALVGELALRRARPRPRAPRGARRSARRPRRRRAPRRRAPAPAPTVATGSPPLPPRRRSSKRASRATNSCGSLPVDAAAEHAADRAPPASSRQAAGAGSARSPRRPRPRRLGSIRASSAAGKRWTAAGLRGPGGSYQISSVTNGITGCSRASARSSTRRGASPRPSSSPVVEARLDDLQVPVAELRPEERVELERRVGEVVGLELLADRGDRALQARGIQRSSTLAPRRGPGSTSAGVEQDQPRGVPHLVGEVAALLDLGLGEADVLGRRHRQQAEAERVGAVGRRSPRAGRCRCRGSSTSGGRRGPGSPSGRRRRGTGSSPANSIPVMIIRATQRKMMSRAVVRTSVG